MKMTDYDMMAVLPSRKLRELLPAEEALAVRYYHHYDRRVSRVVTEMSLSPADVTAVLNKHGIDPSIKYKRPPVRELKPGVKTMPDKEKKLVMDDLILGVDRKEICRKHGITSWTVTKIKRQYHGYLEDGKDDLAAKLYRKLGSCRKTARAMHESERSVAERIDRLGVPRVKAKYRGLTDERKREVNDWIAEGIPTNAIIKGLGVSKTTVNLYKRMRKEQVR